MDPNRKITKKFTKNCLVVKLLIENIFIERLGFGLLGTQARFFEKGGGGLGSLSIWGFSRYIAKFRDTHKAPTYTSLGRCGHTAKTF